MALVGGALGAALLNRARGKKTVLPTEEAPACEGRSKLEVLMGQAIRDEIRRKSDGGWRAGQDW